MIYVNTKLFVNCLNYIESNCCQSGILQVLENNVLILSQLYLGFHGLRILRDKMQLLLQLYMFSYLTFPNA